MPEQLTVVLLAAFVLGVFVVVLWYSEDEPDPPEEQ